MLIQDFWLIVSLEISTDYGIFHEYKGRSLESLVLLWCRVYQPGIFEQTRRNLIQFSKSSVMLTVLGAFITGVAARIAEFKEMDHNDTIRQVHSEPTGH